MWSYVRSAGPGGQNVNKTNSKAILSWSLWKSTCLSERQKERFLALYAHKISSEGIVTLSAQEFRDQGRNADRCLEKLQEMLVAASRVSKRKKTKPSRAAKEKRLSTKRRRSEIKQLRGRSPTEN